MRKIIATIGFVLMILSCNAKRPPLVDLIEVPGGSMSLGSEETEDNKPHKVTLDSFYMAKYPVTMKLWKQFLAETGLYFDWDEKQIYMDVTFRALMDNEEYAAQGMDWYYAVAFCNWLSKKEGLQPAYRIQGQLGWNYDMEQKEEPEVYWNKQANGYRLPTEAEYEYAARGGQVSKGYRYAGSNNPEDIGLYKQDHPYPVGQFKPNELGLYDMGGNVAVWCWDWYDYKAWSWLPEYNPSVDRKEDVREFFPHNFGKIHMKVLRSTMWDRKPATVVDDRGTYPPKLSWWIGIRPVRSKL